MIHRALPLPLPDTRCINIHCIISEKFFKPQLCKSCQRDSSYKPHESTVTFRKGKKTM